LFSGETRDREASYGIIAGSIEYFLIEMIKLFNAVKSCIRSSIECAQFISASCLTYFKYEINCRPAMGYSSCYAND